MTCMDHRTDLNPYPCAGIVNLDAVQDIGRGCTGFGIIATSPTRTSSPAPKYGDTAVRQCTVPEIIPGGDHAARRRPSIRIRIVDLAGTEQFPIRILTTHDHCPSIRQHGHVGISPWRILEFRGGKGRLELRIAMRIQNHGHAFLDFADATGSNHTGDQYPGFAELYPLDAGSRATINTEIDQIAAGIIGIFQDVEGPWNG